MKEFHHHKFCPIRDILSRIGSKWSMLVLVTLDANGTMRFNEIQKSIGDISQRMLTLGAYARSRWTDKTGCLSGSSATR